MTVNENIYQRQFQHESYVYRLSVAAGNDIISALSESDKETLRIFNASIEDIRTSSGKKQVTAINKLSKEIFDTRSEYYDPALAVFYSLLPEFAEYEAEFQKTIIEKATNDEVGDLGVAIDVASATGLGAIVGAAIDQFVSKSNGTAYIISESLNEMLERESQRVRETIARGINDDSTNKEIRDSLFTGGKSVFGKTELGIKLNTRSAYTSIADKAIQALAQTNGGLIGGWINSSIIDGRTSNICASIAAQYADVIARKKSDIPAVPRHIGCRSRVVYIVQHWSQLGLTMRDGKLYVTGDVMPESDKVKLMTQFGLSEEDQSALRRSFPRGRPESNIEQALNNASDEFLDDFFQSKAAVRAFKSGDLKVDELYNNEDRTALTINEIKAKES